MPEQFLPVRPPSLAPDAVDPSISKWGSEAELRFAQYWAATYPDIDLVYQFRFAHPSRMTVDFAHLPTRTGIEVQGAVWVPGRGHSNGAGIVRDQKKIVLGASVGWQILQIASHDVEDGERVCELYRIITRREKSGKH